MYILAKKQFDPESVNNTKNHGGDTMNFLKRLSFIAARCSVMALSTLAGCGKKDDAISAVEEVGKQEGVAAPDIAETEAIAEAGFIYGLPIVMY
jgi:hypothetical protein